MLGRIKEQGRDPKKAFIMATTEDICSWMKDWPEIYDHIVEITKDDITFPNKFNDDVNHSLTYFFEWLFMSMFKGVPGYALEQFFNLGSQGLRDKLAAEEDSFVEIVLIGIEP
jgi:hypothetical protein